jgi:hypothetical protein
MANLLVIGVALTVSLASLPAPASARPYHRSASARAHSGVPNLDIDAGCKDVSKMDLNRTTNYPGCMAEERQAREELQKQWSSYNADAHDLCMHLVTFPALPSYVTLQQCLTMTRDAKNAKGIGRPVDTLGLE